MKSDALLAWEKELDAKQGRYWRGDPYDDSFGIRSGEDLNRWLELRDESAMAEMEGGAGGEGTEPEPFPYAEWAESHRGLPAADRLAHWNGMRAERAEDSDEIEEQLRKGYGLDRPADLFEDVGPVPRDFDANRAFHESERLRKLVEGGDADMEPATWARVQESRALAAQLPEGHPERDQALHTALTLLTAATKHLFDRPRRVVMSVHTRNARGDVVVKESDGRGRTVSETLYTAEEIAAQRVEAEAARRPWEGLNHVTPEMVAGWAMDTRLRFMGAASGRLGRPAPRRGRTAGTVTARYEVRPGELLLRSSTRQLVTHKSLPSAGPYNGTYLLALEPDVAVIVPAPAASDIVREYANVEITDGRSRPQTHPTGWARPRGTLPVYLSPVDPRALAEWREGSTAAWSPSGKPDEEGERGP